MDKLIDQCKLQNARQHAVNKTPEQIVREALKSAIEIMNDIADLCKEDKSYNPAHMLKSWAKRCEVEMQVADEKREHDMRFVYNTRPSVGQAVGDGTK